jgi:hypothetical protein
MSKYVVVDNRPNQIATIHLLSCPHLGVEPSSQTTSATRTSFNDGLEALRLASAAKTFMFCGHCLSEYRRLLATLRE